ncbi:hypothetical protein QAD02_009937 [Eretmocerus hayati]|uniref:Uncharacterized protein n=1 Tax=Eretmocerus hayati TaxID=131215 RepID=A0ACC2NAP0_9HYME|nr:hypothetical protein QAD02_009937 [Eretmocerus hayati]
MDLIFADQKWKMNKNNEVSGAHFDYGNPKDWPKDYPSCGGMRQSPINIQLQDVGMIEPGQQPVYRNRYGAKPKRMTITNNGHTVQLTGEWQKGYTPTISGGPLNGTYQFSELHFHWGSNNFVGSEHLINNHSFPIEMHIVHWKETYGNKTEATKHPNGLAVLGYLMSIHKSPNRGLKMMQMGFQHIVEPSRSTKIDPFPLSFFDPNVSRQKTARYFTYPGSLTTPPCSESVTWLLSVRLGNIATHQLDSLRRLRLSNHDNHNNRPTQQLNGRSVSSYLEIQFSNADSM